MWDLAREWDRLVENNLEEGIFRAIVKAVGPIAVASVFYFILAFIFALVYRKSKKGVLYAFFLIFGVFSVGFAYIWRSRWITYYLSAGSMKEELILSVPLFANLLLVLLLWILCMAAFRAKRKVVRAEKLEKRRLEQERMAELIAQKQAAYETSQQDANEAAYKAEEREMPAETVCVADAADNEAFEKIRALHGLLKEGVLTEDEFKAKMCELLSRI